MGAVVRGYIDILTIIINFPYSTCISSFFWQQHPYFFVHFVNVFRSLILYLCKIAHALRVSKHVTKSIRNIARGVDIN